MISSTGIGGNISSISHRGAFLAPLTRLGSGFHNDFQLPGLVSWCGGRYGRDILSNFFHRQQLVGLQMPKLEIAYFALFSRCPQPARYPAIFPSFFHWDRPQHCFQFLPYEWKNSRPAHPTPFNALSVLTSCNFLSKPLVNLCQIVISLVNP